jgi:hypothetical protein
MWFKRHEPELFFQEMLKISSMEERVTALMRDTQRFGRHIEVKPPHPQQSGLTWTRVNHGNGSVALQAGFDEIPGVGPPTATAILETRAEEPFKTWPDLLKVKGIGPKTLETIQEFVGKDDPFGATWLDRAISTVKEQINAGDLGTIPRPTHVAADLPYSTGEDIEVVWLGVIHSRNVRDLFEFNQAKGAELDMENMTIDGKPIRDPQLNEWCVMVGDDESDQIGLRCDRWHYPKWRDLIWKMRPGKDLVLIRGYKPGWMPTRQITISEMWVIDPEL